MRKAVLRNLPAYRFNIFRQFSDRVTHAVFTREGGVSPAPYDSLNVRFGVGDAAADVRENRRLVSAALGVEAQQLISADQTHSKKVQMADEEFLRFFAGKEISGVDAFVTKMRGAALMIQVADCQAILLYDPVTGVIAAVHAGWKGLMLDISGAAVWMMKKDYGVDPANILAGIAPSLGPCCAVFSDPGKELPWEFHPYIDRKKRVDLWSFSLDQLQKHGLQKKHIELACVCTQCEGGRGNEPRGRFFSHRAEKGVTGRFGVAIMLRQ